MRTSQLNKIKSKKINEKYSDFELEELNNEMNEYKSLLTNIGYKLTRRDVKLKKKKNRCFLPKKALKISNLC